jgi:hypothetical protein
MKFLRISLALGALTLALAQAPKDSRKPQVREVRATGCVRILRDGCILLKTLDGKTTYTFRAAPQPDTGEIVTVQGTAHQGNSQCKQGVAIDVTDWEPTGDSCID